jgi:hypothetical protein
MIEGHFFTFYVILQVLATESKRITITRNDQNAIRNIL